MSKPQQQEIARSGRGEVDQQGRRAAREAKGGGPAKGNTGPVPEENQPGRRRRRNQDKPLPPKD